MEEHQAVVKPLVEGARIASLADYREAYDKSLLDPEASGWRQRDGQQQNAPQRKGRRLGAGAAAAAAADGRRSQSGGTQCGWVCRLPPPQGFWGPLVEEFHWTKKWEKKNADFHK